MKRLTLLPFIFLAFCCIGYNGNKANDVSEKDTISAKDSIDTLLHRDTIYIPELPSSDDSLNIIHTVKLENGDKRIFFIVLHEYRYQLYTKIRNDNSVSPERIMTPYNYCDDEDFYADGLSNPFSYRVSPNGKVLFLVGQVPANSTGWIYQYQLFKVDCISLKEDFIGHGAAIRATKDGVIIAQARIKEGYEDKCTAAMEWLIHDELYDFNGKFISKSSKEYSEEEMMKKYRSSSDKYSYVKNFKHIYCPE